MRVFTIRKGHYTGEHYIYESEEEFKRYHPDVQLKYWSKDTSIEVNDWVRADDGYILQCLRTFTWNKIAYGKIYPTKLYRFCNGAFSAYYGINGVKWKRFYGVATKRKDVSSIGEGITWQEKYFGLYLKAGYTPLEALEKVHDTSTWSGYKRGRYLDKYLHGEKVMALILQSGDINNKVQQITGKTIPEIVEMEILRQIQALHMADEHDISLKEGRQIVSFLNDVFSNKKNPKNIPEADEVIPPLLST